MRMSFPERYTESVRGLTQVVYLMGRTKPDVPDPPDYTEIAEASEYAADLSFQIAEDQLAWAMEQYEMGLELTTPILDDWPRRRSLPTTSPKRIGCGTRSSISRSKKS